jgi:hypothetical protein
MFDGLTGRGMRHNRVMVAVRSWRSVRSWGTWPRLALMAAALVGLAALRVPRPPTVCLLRGTTGIPCPFCGSTTAGVCLGHADVAGALHASPLAVAMAVGFVALPVVRRSPIATRWRSLPRSPRQSMALTAILATLALSEMWQLMRFGVV